ncbi:hypothetical protein [Roseovarius sp. 217]|uniref:hypothetical protein n=1 Tax=Roseovarius sp. (strain 217) TaxID=314264 RepID=UPI0000687008|nr:hypothetical protein [Roseovarius sp. 217]EAQ23628.1 hypothetical protein ROS217_08119 [Roseovarius sp. 217]
MMRFFSKSPRPGPVSEQKQEVRFTAADAALALEQRGPRLLEFVANCVEPQALGVEIGPFDRPLLTRPDWNVRYADVNTTDDLKYLAGRSPLRHVEKVVEVDYVLKSVSLPRAISGHGVKFVFGSHVYEHIPNLLGFLRDIATELGSGGTVIGAFPDRRYTYDIDRPRTTLGQFLDRHARDISQPDPQTVFDHFYHNREVKAGQIWTKGADHGAPRRFSLGHAQEMMQQAQTRYVDVHCNVLTDQEFVDLTEVFPELGINLGLHALVKTYRPLHEFHFCLKVL